MTPTHYWSVIRLGTPHLVLWKFSDNRCAYGYVSHKGDLPNRYFDTDNPIFINDPEKELGDWRPISEWMNSK